MRNKSISKAAHNPTAQDADPWAAFDAMTDEDIARAVAHDPDAVPIMPKGWWRDAEVVAPETKVHNSIPIEKDVLEWFKSQGPGYQSRMNAVLRSYIQSLRKAG
ncbi:MAG: BrnA antitoxin family protein [Alphaproteobacteria bacterium]|nr:BrnA antitoxin family protein [Alphaproteobacteria bacterium]